MRTRIKGGLTAIARGLQRLMGLIFTVPVRLVRLMIRLPVLLWHGLVGMLRFLVRLPGLVWRGLTSLVRYTGSFPGRVLRGGRRLLRRIRLGIVEARARLAFWWRSRVFPARTLSPNAQGVALLAIAATLAILAWLAVQLRQTPESGMKTVIVTATSTQADVAAPGALATPRSERNTAPLQVSSPLTSTVYPEIEGVVAYSLRQNGNTDIYARELEDDKQVRLSYHPGEDEEPAWAPDGETMALVSHRGGNWDVYRLDLLSGALIRLTRHPHYDAHPSWSPDGAFIAFESYRSGNLDLFIMATNGSQIHQLTANQAADFAPAWSPDGRHIAFVSYRDGSKDVFLYPLDAGTEAAVINLTQTPDRDEDSPSWSPDGSRLAFSVGRFGTETIFITSFDWSSKFLDDAQTQLFNPGAVPDWSPDGSRLIYEYQRGGQSYLIADAVEGWGAGYEVFGANAQIGDPSWGYPSVDPQLLVQGRQAAAMGSASVFIEEILPTPESGPPYTIVALKDVNGGDDREFLSDRVNDSFEALRQRVLEETGVDYLATIGDSFRAVTVEPPPGQSPRSWHKAGRAFDLNQGLYEREEQLIELVREDIGFRTYWRVYLRAARQDGSLGKPLHQAPWDLKPRQASGTPAREGGELKQEVPLGYYVDFTELAADYGWERVPANNRWRHEWAEINWWQFQKPQGMSWLEAMLELYRSDQIDAVLGPSSPGGP